jgi:hypothetical protein
MNAMLLVMALRQIESRRRASRTGTSVQRLSCHSSRICPSFWMTRWPHVADEGVRCVIGERLALKPAGA